MRRLKAFDWFSMLAGAILVVASVGMAYGQTGAGKSVSIDSPQGEWRYSLEVDRVIDDFDTNGGCSIVIEDSAVFVRESDCPLKICIQMGRISRQNDWIACVPHRIIITIEGESEVQVDDVSY